ALRERDAFLSIASHELKNPLTSLLGRAQLMQRRLSRTADGARAAEDAELIIGQARRISALLNDMLDMSRLESGQFEVERTPLDLATLIRGAVSELQASTTSHELRVCDPPAPLIVAGDAVRLEQVFTNLLGNAVKYSPDGGNVTISMGADGNQALVSISDTGLGIPPEALPQLFKRFYRVMRDDAQHISGSGIGLYVVKEIVTGHGGTIEVASAVGAGSTFTVRLPLLVSEMDANSSQ
ncbi:MAG TPA: HAMP domain-containing sensor histidine kinase, partial [Roseiflexaceae bacterium]|nr:HAMP domain-containing sensor histidine kinase [Roseiflexaceae bacterium]